MGETHRGRSAQERSLIDRYFLEERNAFSKRRPFRTSHVSIALGVLLIIVIGLILTFGKEGEKSQAVDASRASSGALPAIPMQNSGLAALASGQAANAPGGRGSFFGSSPLSGLSSGLGGREGGASTRNRSANQVIRRGAQGTDPDSALPMGYAVSVKLINAILSTDSASPVIAEVTSDVYSHGALAIPAKTRAIGTARYDETSRRIQLRFQTFVYPEGDQHPIAALGMMPDGSSGLDGDYHSAEGSRQSGRFLTHFIAGMADGMKECDSGGAFSQSYEPGSVKNGLLNGAALTANDEAGDLTHELQSTKPTMTLPAGALFLLFFEQQYVP